MENNEAGKYRLPLTLQKRVSSGVNSVARRLGSVATATACSLRRAPDDVEAPRASHVRRRRDATPRAVT
ncbi:hypothetical protein MSG28_004778 [Choristoneura fumiferana]|uniref:Uncharacterized protein n=1 Tax=Choristoneura fumiferana TaxID=7141 RepID=A0ACC0K792_CHOFU|nr:hypothetical protein MSG28_004778 [Choristoneura fumiferana]